MAFKDLERSVDLYCGVVANRVLRSRAERRIWDFPAVVVCCKMKKNGKIFKGKSAKPRAGMYKPPLSVALNKLGGVGQQSQNGCKFPIGYCAEPHAANKLIVSGIDAELDNIVFSFALRPRTRQVIPYCANCKEVFSTLK